CERVAGTRQQPPHGTAAAALARELHGAAVATHDAEHRGQTEAAPGHAGGEEGLERAPSRRLVHARAAVRDLDEDVATRREVGGTARVGEVGGGGLDRAGPDRDGAL